MLEKKIATSRPSKLARGRKIRESASLSKVKENFNLQLESMDSNYKKKKKKNSMASLIVSSYCILGVTFEIVVDFSTSSQGEYFIFPVVFFISLHKLWHAARIC